MSSESKTDPIRGHFVLELSDVRRGLWESGTGRALFLAVAGWLFMSLVLQSMHFAGAPLAPWMPPAFAGIAFGALLFGFNRAASKVMENRKETERDITWEFDDAGYCVKTPSSESRGAWDTVHRVKEGARTFLLYPCNNLYQIIPKRAFREEDVPRIRELFRTRVTPRPAKNPMFRTIVLWVVLVVAFLAVWQFFETPVSP